jgi:hypothetical protein
LILAAGYSGTPLGRKLSLKSGLRVWFDAIPQGVFLEIEKEDLELHILSSPMPPIEAALVFVTARASLEAKLEDLLPRLAPSGFIWVCWPKKASRVPTDITEDVIREIVLPSGLVDVKVCALDEVWSGLKVVVRRQNRGVR